MYLSLLTIENFRGFGEGANALRLPLNPGITAIVGENDTGKTAVVDALRLALGARDQEFFRVDEHDFHQPPSGSQRAREIRVSCRFEGLTIADKAAFAEYLTYEERDGKTVPVLFLNWRATAPQQSGGRRFTTTEARSGRRADGPIFDQQAKFLLCATYLRPLRDAERAMSAGRGSRLSQVLQHTKEIKEFGVDYDAVNGPPKDLGTLSVLGIGDLSSALLGKHKGVQSASDNLNTKYLRRLSFAGSILEGHITVSGLKGDDATRRRVLLEKLDLALRDSVDPSSTPNRGLGSNNILFMACELLLLASEAEGFPLLLIEEPEAHLHPQRQLRLIQFLNEKVDEKRSDGQKIQIILTTHSPNLASTIDLNNLVLLQGRRAHSLAFGRTELDKSDYGFLARFLDVTKANLFFARGVLIVEGDAENILLPEIARLIGRDLTENGVSIVNVGGIGLRRFARIFQRKDASDGVVDLPVACVTDLDVMPDCAPEIIGKVEAGKPWPDGRRWRAKKDFPGEKLDERRTAIRARASGQRVETFVSDCWTLEYDLAWMGLHREVWIAAQLAKADENIHAGKDTVASVTRRALREFEDLEARGLSVEQVCSHIYKPFADGASKAIAAQYLAGLLRRFKRKNKYSSEEMRDWLPEYLLRAIDFVTQGAPDGFEAETA
ncbi:ATP-dependent nuclease [Bradyrhizobium sp. HKCCYLS2033]|uniref:ATP-dependent nuclease n=1 Tax=Bradyrhizobium sp. HKCCYLS2033 TaxID=3420739 RepID=UPI003EB6D508